MKSDVVEDSRTTSHQKKPTTRHDSMKMLILNLTFAALAAQPALTVAQGTYLNAPDGGPTHIIEVDVNGAVRIGSSDFLTKFEVNGSIRSSDSRDLGGNITVHNPRKTGGAVNAWTFFNTTGEYGDGLQLLSYSDVEQGSRRLAINDNGNTLLVPSGGNVGLGTTDPLDKLEVRGNLRLSSGNRSLLFQDDGNYDFSLVHNGGISLNIRSPEFTNNSPLGVTIASFVNNGTVGVGTEAPQGKLHVVSDNTSNRGIVSETTLSSAEATLWNLRRNGEQKWDINLGANNDDLHIYSWGTQSYVLNVENQTGNVGIGTSAPQAKLDVNGQINCTVLELTSDRNQKQNIRPVDVSAILDQVLQLPVATWAYTNQSEVLHIGPMAQDFKAAFHVGSDDKHIGAGDVGGVALASIQGLNRQLTIKLSEKDAEIAALRQELSEVRAQQSRIHARFETLERQFASTVPQSKHPVAVPAVQGAEQPGTAAQ